MSPAVNRRGSVRRRLLRSHLAVASVGLVMLAAAMLALMGLRARMLDVLQRQLPLSDAALGALGGSYRSVVELETGLVLGDAERMAQRRRIWEHEIGPALARLRHLTGGAPFFTEDRLDGLLDALDALREAQRRIEEAGLDALARHRPPATDPEVRLRISEELAPALIRVAGALGGLAAAGRAAQAAEARRLRLMADAVVGFSAALLLALLLSTLVMARRRADWLVRPLARLAEATSELTRRRAASADIPVEGDDELAELTRAFNRMRQELARQEETVRQTVTKLQAAIASLLAATAQHVAGAEEQAADAQQVAQAVDALSGAARESVARARALEESAEWADAISRVGHECLEELRGAMAAIEQGVAEMDGPGPVGGDARGVARVREAASRAVELLRRTGDTIKTLAEIAEEGRGLASDTLAAVDRQSVQLEEVRQAMAHLRAVIEENLTSTSRVERVARDLDSLSTRLREQIEPRAGGTSQGSSGKG